MSVMTLWEALRREQLSAAELARRSGLTAETMKVCMCNGLRSERTCWRLESGLGYKYSIVSNSMALADRQRCVELFGVDPFVASRTALRRLAEKHGFDFSGCFMKADFAAAVIYRASALRGEQKLRTQKTGI